MRIHDFIVILSTHRPDIDQKECPNGSTRWEIFIHNWLWRVSKKKRGDCRPVRGGCRPVRGGCRPVRGLFRASRAGSASRLPRTGRQKTRQDTFESFHTCIYASKLSKVCWCIFSHFFVALVVFGRKYMCENSHWCVDVFFSDIFGVSSLRWIMQAAIALKTIEDYGCSFLSFFDISRPAIFFLVKNPRRLLMLFYQNHADGAGWLAGWVNLENFIICLRIARRRRKFLVDTSLARG